MDLSRAKTILIICFFLLNLFLAAQRWQLARYFLSGSGITAAEAEHIEQVMSDAGYQLVTLLPRQTPRLALLYVTQQPLAAAEWQRRVFGAAETKKIAENGKITFLRGYERLEVMPGGQLLYTRLNPEQKFAGPIEDNRQLAEKFMRERGFWQDNLTFDLMFAKRPGTYIYRYVQIFQGRPLFSGFVEVLITDGMIKEVRTFQLQPLELSGREVRVISAAEALAVFIGKAPSLPDRRIVDITLGYFSQYYDASRWEIAPAWRIAAADGRLFYINAFTGELERQEQ